MTETQCIEPGQVFRNWTVLGPSCRTGKTGRKSFGYDCKCACGRVSWVERGNLRTGASTQCRSCAQFALRNYEQQLPVGHVIGRWTVLDHRRSDKGCEVLCRCECGEEKWKVVSEMVRARSLSCKECSGIETRIVRACPNNEVRRKLMRRIYSIVRRCTSSKYKHFHSYGGRGIKCFEPWIKDRALFFEYLTSLPGYDIRGNTIDRINNDGNYEPGNLRFVPLLVQNNNRRNTKDKFALESLSGLLYGVAG